jgi:hypothetical protein
MSFTCKGLLFRKGLVSSGILLGLVSACFAETLITPEEGMLPSAKGALALASRGITRGPKLELLPMTGPLHSPLHLKVKFQSFQGSKIDPETVQASYLKSPVVDLTKRLKPFVAADGIDMPAAELPPGEHIIKIDVKDSEGRIGATSFVLKVEP